MRIIKNLIIGSGPAGIATAMALKNAGQTFELLDVALDLEKSIELDVARLASSDPGQWDDQLVTKLFPPPVTSSSGVERRYYFGSDFPYRVPDNLIAKTVDCKPEFSHGLGGFGNVWGAAILPYTQAQLKDWPIALKDLETSYHNISGYMPISGQSDSLAHHYPLYASNYSSLAMNASTEHFLNGLSKRQDRLNQNGIQFGRARVAVHSARGPSSCQYCGMCLDGCPYGSLFNPRELWKKLEQQNVPMHKGLFALEVHEQDNGVMVKAADTLRKTIHNFHAERVYLAAGQLGSTQILARSMNILNTPIPIQDSQYFFFPFLSYKGFETDIRFTLAESFLEVTNSQLGEETVHLQVYGKSQIVEKTIHDQLPRFFPKQAILDRLYIIQGFLPSQSSGHLKLTLTAADKYHNNVVVTGFQNSAAITLAKKTQALLRRVLLDFGLVLPGNLTLVPPGRSFHAGGSFPMGGNHKIFRSDRLGRPADYKRVHIVDSANFTNIAGSTIAYTIMANADRIIREIFVPTTSPLI